MLAGLTALELGRLRMSVGYGTHKKGRPLSPIEVGSLIQRACSEGMSLKECARAIQLDGTGHIRRFVRILDLPDDIRHLIDWGSKRGLLGFTSAVELARLENTEDQRALAKAVLSERLYSKEVRQAVQLRRRSRRSMAECIREVLNMRPQIEKRYIFVGSVTPENANALCNLSQAERDAKLTLGIKDIGLRNVTGRLGHRFFTLVGNGRFNASMVAIGKENIEEQIRSYLSRVLQDAASTS